MNVLEVVDDEEQRPFLQVVGHTRHRVLGGLGDVEGLADRAGDEARVGDRGEVDEHGAVGELAGVFFGTGKRQPGLPHAAWAGQRYESHLVAAE